MIGLQKKAAYLSDKQIRNATSRMNDYRHALRNRCILELTILAGLRAKEVSLLRWEHLLDDKGDVGNSIKLTNDICKKKSGGIVFLNNRLRNTLVALLKTDCVAKTDRKSAVIKSERGKAFTTQSIVNLLWVHYRKCDIHNASSHSGRRTFITNTARKIGEAGGSINDVAALARHSNISTTQRYIERNEKAQRDVVNLI